MNAKEIVEKLQKSHAIASSSDSDELADSLASVLKFVIRDVEGLVPKYRPPQPSDDGRWCFLEELPSDAPPTLVRLNGEWVPTAGGHSWTHSWQYWTVAGWRELIKGVWPCERPEGGGA